MTLLTNGAFILFLLWYVTPREIFEPDQPEYPHIDMAPKADRPHHSRLGAPNPQN